MFKENLLSQFPKQLNAFLLNFEYDVSGLNLTELITHCKENKLTLSNFIFYENNIEYNDVLLCYVFLILSEENHPLLDENKDFLKSIISKSDIFNENNVSKNLESKINSVKYDILNESEKTVNSDKRKEIMKSLVEDSVLDKRSIIYQCYFNPRDFLENTLPKLPNYFNKYYEILHKEDISNLDLFERTITKEQIDLLINKDITNILNFCTSYSI